MTTLLYLMACLMSPAPLIHLAESRVSMKIDLYDTDCYAWTQEQAALLRDQQAQALDYANLAEEVESLGRSQQQALESHLEVVLTHLLAWCYGSTRPDARRGWRLVIREQRRRGGRRLAPHPRPP